LAFLFIAALIVALYSVRETGAQGDTPFAHVQHIATKAEPPGVIDGKKNPELIPDEVALRMIVLAAAEPADASEAQKERALAKLRPIGLSDLDTLALMNLLGEFRARTDEVNKQIADVRVRAPIPHSASTEYKLLVELSTQKRQIADDTVAALPARLSQEGLAKLSVYLPEVKKGIKITPYGVSAK
jgi:hypothetical protein